MSPRLVEQIHQLRIECLRRLLGPELALTAQSLVEALTLAEALKLVYALIGFAYAILSSEVDCPRVDRCRLKVNHALSEVSEQVKTRVEPSHQMRLILAVGQ